MNKVRIQIWIKPSDKKLLQKLSKELGLSLSGLIQTYVRKEVKQLLKK